MTDDVLQIQGPVYLSHGILVLIILRFFVYLMHVFIYIYIHNFVDELVWYWQLAADANILTLLEILNFSFIVLLFKL